MALADERPRRVAVIGTAGAGKTTFARALAARLGVSHVEFDALFWLPDWQEPDRAEFKARVMAALDGSAGWVADGNYSTVQDAVVARADAVVWLDIGLFTCLRRVSTRAIRRSMRGEILWGTNREQWRRTLGSRLAHVVGDHDARSAAAPDGGTIRRRGGARGQAAPFPIERGRGSLARLSLRRARRSVRRRRTRRGPGRGPRARRTQRRDRDGRSPRAPRRRGRSARRHGRTPRRG